MIRSLRQEPAPWLLAASAVLAAALWHIPVPAFIFADGGSGSTPPSCQCSVDNCKSWSLVNDQTTPTCRKPPWEHCQADVTNDVDCAPPAGGPSRKMPKSAFYYEAQSDGVRCNNLSAHGKDGGGNDIWDNVQWIRDDVSVTSSGQSGQKKIEFKPTLVVSFSGFSHANVCSGSTGQIDIKSAFFAKMSVCGEDDITDPDKGSSPGEVGWAFVTHTFKKSGGLWRFTAGTNPHGEAFSISKTCTCSQIGDDPDEFVEFRSRVDRNSGVKLGSGGDAFVGYSVSDDTTSCTPVNP